MISQERLLQVYELKVNNEMLHEVNLELSSELNEILHKVDYLILDVERFNKVLCVGSPYDANNALVFMENGS